MELRNQKKFVYESFIRVGGLSLLPPLITDERRTLLRDFKRKAVELEKLSSSKKDSQARTFETDNFNEELVNNSTKAITLGSLEQALAFSNDFDVNSCTISNDNVETVPCDREKVPKLTSYVFDVSEYSDNGIVLFNDGKNDVSNTSTFETNPQSGTKAKLIRRNSYILESPSPALLNYLKIQAQSDLNLEKTALQENRQLESASATCSNIEDSAYETLEDRPNSEVELNSHLENYNFDPTTSMNEAIEKLLEKHFGSSNSEVTERSPNTQIGYDDEIIIEGCSAIPDLKDFLDILERHKADIETKSSSSHRNALEFREELRLRHEEDSEISQPNEFNSSTPLLIDFESDSCDNDPLPYFQQNCMHDDIESDPLHVLMSLDDYQRLSDPFDVYETRNPCSRELFADNSIKVQRKLTEEWAANILTAAAKGFLVRRLKRTIRVQRLIETIHDSVVCAMNLHKEDTDSIQEADVELHRRLILQVSSACDEFYDIFFNITTRDQMALITLDRQRQIDKLRRSRFSMKKMDSDDSDRSTPRSRQSLNIRQRKNLTPSFAA